MKAVVGLCVLAALALVPAPGWAEDPIGRFSLGGSVGYSSYGLGDVNERISGVGNRYLEVEHVPPLTGLEKITFGWTFWGDLKTELPFLDGFFVSGGYGVSSGNTESPDMDNKLRVAVSQEAFHVRLLYVPPWRFHEDTRLFVGGGPLIITKQEVRVTQENRSVLEEPWTEEISYEGTGLGWQFGVIAEYMIQDRLSLAMDLGYRLANISYSDDWSARQNVSMDYPPRPMRKSMIGCTTTRPT